MWPFSSRWYRRMWWHMLFPFYFPYHPSQYLPQSPSKQPQPSQQQPPPFSQPMYYMPPPPSPQMELEMLKDYKNALEEDLKGIQEEIKGIEERIKELKKYLEKSGQP